ncbi:uncharacterized protein OGAPODRAFT_10149 [Ogataea polymorpha]|uniref:uncharacterized protein n=1 Tax=Ogataea polymorpha TaxID=460523 RepID=UPI0007F4186F|nr:uncharacterized protein OGAPODRAFT_10149 [Ogataea polymorpha]OBA13483.1 hypothetical protein OGAPODRAFT_10149 [Ogataea polymorpha]
MGQQISRSYSSPCRDSDAQTTRSSASQKSGFLHSTAASSPRKWRKFTGLLRRRRAPETLSEPTRMVSRSLLSPAQSSVDALRSVSSNINASSGSVAESSDEPEQNELLTSQFRSLSSLLETVTMNTLRRLINVNVDYVGERIYPEDNLDGSMDTDFASFVHRLTTEDLLQHALGNQMELGRTLSFFRAFRFDNSSHLGYNSSLHEFERLVPVLIVGVVGLNVPQAQSEHYRSWVIIVMAHHYSASDPVLSSMAIFIGLLASYVASTSNMTLAQHDDNSDTRISTFRDSLYRIFRGNKLSQSVLDGHTESIFHIQTPLDRCPICLVDYEVGEQGRRLQLC